MHAHHCAIIDVLSTGGHLTTADLVTQAAAATGRHPANLVGAVRELRDAGSIAADIRGDRLTWSLTEAVSPEGQDDARPVPAASMRRCCPACSGTGWRDDTTATATATGLEAAVAAWAQHRAAYREAIMMGVGRDVAAAWRLVRRAEQALAAAAGGEG
jgi:hypothetical protein